MYLGNIKCLSRTRSIWVSDFVIASLNCSQAKIRAIVERINSDINFLAVSMAPGTVKTCKTGTSVWYFIDPSQLPKFKKVYYKFNDTCIR